MRTLVSRFVPALLSVSLAACGAGAAEYSVTTPGSSLQVIAIDNSYRYLIDPNSETCVLAYLYEHMVLVSCEALARNLPAARPYITWLGPAAPALRPAPAPPPQ
jgi:hypothetical protein